MYHKISFLDVFSASVTRLKAPVSDTPNVSMTSQFFYYVINHLAYLQFFSFDKVKPIGGHKSVNRLITKLTFSVTR